MIWKQAVDIVLSRGLWQSMRSVVACRAGKRARIILCRALLSILKIAGIKDSGAGTPLDNSPQNVV